MDVILLDAASMATALQFVAVLYTLPHAVRVKCVGDEHQLASVRQSTLMPRTMVLAGLRRQRANRGVDCAIQDGCRTGCRRF